MDFEKFTPTMIEVARQGRNVASIVDAIERIEKIEGMVKIMALFKHAFGLFISDVFKMEPWHHFNKNGRGASDEEIDQIMMPLIRKNLGMEDWNTP